MSRPLRSVLALGVAVLAAGTTSPAALATTSPDKGFRTTATVERSHLQNGQEQLIDQRTVTIAVDRTKNLRDRDGINVTWSGARPTAGIIGDTNSGAATQEEYPVVLLQCRGTDDASLPLAEQLRPETCFTQNPRERFQADFSSKYPVWRFDRWAAADERTRNVDVPDPRPAACPSAPTTGAERFVPFVAANGTTYPVGTQGCAGMPPEMSNLATQGLPSNSTYGITALDGRGSARFDVRTAEDNASLGCGAGVPCALVVVPVMGVSCDLDLAGLPVADRPSLTTTQKGAAVCAKTGHFAPGEITAPDLTNDLAVSGSLWWSASNWRQRVTVPLTFAPAADVCDIAGAKPPVALYGSELMAQATTAWAPHFCLGAGASPFKHVQTGEPQARHLLTAGTIKAAFTTDPPDAAWPRPTVLAPVAASGFAIGFSVDDAERNALEQLRLTPRLLAKLLTLSYPVLPDMRTENAALRHNPINISNDPEFRALNPTVKNGVPTTEAASTLYSLSSDSDVMRALTAYLQADPDARAFLDGTPDSWGMVVNPAYKGIALPTDSWPQLDDFVLDPPLNECFAAVPTPYLNQVAAPTQRLATIAQALQYSLSPSQVVCSSNAGTGLGAKLTSIGRQNGGFHFLLGVMSLADAARYGVRTASLLSSVSPTAPAAFTGPAGRSFVAPTNAALKHAFSHLEADPAKRTWTLDPVALRKDAAAYPGAMLVSAAVPVTGLTMDEARRYAAFLEWVTTTGQQPGTGVGQLPAGYLPMTATNGFSALTGYTRRAAAAVAAQSAVAPELVEAPRPATATPAATRPPSSAATPPASAPVGAGTTGPLPSVTPSATAPAPQVAPAPSSRGVTAALGLGATSQVLPYALVAGLLLGALGAAATGRGGLANPARTR